jgi:hypothetical protein
MELVVESTLGQVCTNQLNTLRVHVYPTFASVILVRVCAFQCIAICAAAIFVNIVQGAAAARAEVQGELPRGDTLEPEDVAVSPLTTTTELSTTATTAANDTAVNAIGGIPIDDAVHTAAEPSTIFIGSQDPVNTMQAATAGTSTAMSSTSTDTKDVESTVQPALAVAVSLNGEDQRSEPAVAGQQQISAAVFNDFATLNIAAHGIDSDTAATVTAADVIGGQRTVPVAEQQHETAGTAATDCEQVSCAHKSAVIVHFVNANYHH